MEPPTPDADALRSTLESLLSVENLQVDSYLRGHLTSQLYVPLAVLARCDRVVALGAAPPAIAEAARASTALRLDPSGTMAKPDVADKRNTLLLRDVPPEAQAEEVRALFDAEGCPAPAELRAEAGGSWVVRFAEEEQCLDAVGVLRGRTLRGSEVKARVKTEDLLHSLAAAHPAPSQPSAAPGADDLAGAEPLRIAAAAAAAGTPPQQSASPSAAGPAEQQYAAGWWPERAHHEGWAPQGGGSSLSAKAKKEKEAARWGDRETSDEDNAFLDGPPMARKASG